MPRQEFVEAYKEGNSPFTYASRMEMHEILAAKIRQEGRSFVFNAKWQLHEIQGSYYAVQMIRDGNICLGSWVSLKTLMSPLSVLDTGETGATMFVDERGNPLYATQPLQDQGVDFTRGFQNYYMSG